MYSLLVVDWCLHLLLPELMLLLLAGQLDELDGQPPDISGLPARLLVEPETDDWH